MTRRFPLLVLIGAVLVGRGAFAAEPADSAFERLRSLAGDWEAKTPKGGTLRVSYRLTSRDSVLVETWAPGTRSETLTVYHLDGRSLLATHYCAQGNQPRLALKSAGTAGYVFEFRDATNLASPAASHLSRLRIELVDSDHFVEEETYAEGGKEDTSLLRFARVK